MNFKLGIFAFLSAILLIVSCSKENIDNTSEEEEEMQTEVVNCNLEVMIGIDTLASAIVFTADIMGGTAPFEYLWSNDETTSYITALFTESYEVTVTDSEGCIASGTYNTSINGDCNNFKGGIQLDSVATGVALLAYAEGGTSPYAYEWSTGETSEGIMLEQSGEYTVTIVDATGCVLSFSYSHTTSDPCNNLSASATQVFNSNNIIANGTGGTEPYAYDWSNGATTQEIEVDSSGTYSVNIIDINGCTASASIEINTDPCSNFGIYLVQDSTSTVVYANAFGGTNPYSYLWSNGEANDNITGEAGTVYEVTVTDAIGCAVSDEILVQ